MAEGTKTFDELQLLLYIEQVIVCNSPLFISQHNAAHNWLLLNILHSNLLALILELFTHAVALLEPHLHSHPFLECAIFLALENISKNSIAIIYIILNNAIFPAPFNYSVKTYLQLITQKHNFYLMNTSAEQSMIRWRQIHKRTKVTTSQVVIFLKVLSFSVHSHCSIR